MAKPKKNINSQKNVTLNFFFCFVSNLLQVTVISNEECKKKLTKFNVEPAHICAFSPGMSDCTDPVQPVQSVQPSPVQSSLSPASPGPVHPVTSGVDSCSGDSGGPATVQEGGRITQVNASLSEISQFKGPNL